MVSVNRAQLRYLAEKGSSRARALVKVLDRPEWLLGTTLLGTNLATLTLNAVATLFVLENFGPRYEYLTILITFPLILILGEALPKALFQRYADRLARQIVYPLYVVSWFLSPMVFALASIARFFAFSAGIHPKKKTPFVTREELELAFQASERQRGVKDLERRMIDRIFSLSDRQAKEIMIPLVDVVSIEADMTLTEAAAEMKRSGFSRLLVYDGPSHNIVGWINHYDLLFAKSQLIVVRALMRTVRFIPATVFLDHLLASMQQRGDSLAMVVDEYGGAIGLVTLEDVLEEVVGEIEDEYDFDPPFIRRIDSNRIVVRGRIPIVQLNDVLPQPIPMGDYETLAGFLASEFQRIPAKGQVHRLRETTFRIVRATDRSIEEVEIEYPERRSTASTQSREPA